MSKVGHLQLALVRLEVNVFNACTTGLDLVNMHPAFKFVRMWPFCIHAISIQFAISTY